MIWLVEMILMGVWATFFMDFAASLLVKKKVVRPTLEPQVVGRWALYMLKGKFVHQDIDQTPPLSHEKSAAFISHYLIGIALAGVYLFLELMEPAIRDQPWIALAFGVATIVLPWLWLFPSIGIGFLASKSPRQSDFLVFSSINHTNFGIGMAIWVVGFRRLLGF